MSIFIRAHILISGRVQGVFFRYHTKKQAQKLGLAGWVRNLANGKVEAEVVGPKPKVEKMLTWFWQGSPTSKVKNIKIVSKENVPSTQAKVLSTQFIQKP